MVTIALVCVPLVAMWMGSLALAWVRTPARRGSLAQRWRDLRAPAASNTRESGLVDLSHRAAAYLLALRVGSVVRGIAYLVLIACLVLQASPIVAIIALASMLWLYNHWQQAANIAFHAVTNDTSVAFGESALAYQFPSQRRGRLWNLAESGPASLLYVTGLGLLLTASLSLVYNSDALISPVPGIYVQHSHLPFWFLGLISSAAGALLVSSGAWVDRATKRRAMRRETAMPTWRTRRPQMVFLRPFGSEELRVPAHQGPRRDGLALLLPRRDEFLEDVLTWLLWSRGEVIAIAKPGGSSARTVGAAHHPVQKEQDWMETVSTLLARAGAVVLVPGTTPGVSWEYDQVQSNHNYARKALIVNPDPSADPKSFLAILGASPGRAEELRERQLLVLAAVSRPNGPRLLCSSLAEDIDMEVAVEWFLTKELPKGGRLGKARRILASLAALSRRRG
jgi:hypothetical protein